MSIAQYFVVGLATDAFFVAFKIPNFLRRLFMEGAFSHVFVSVLAEYKRHNNRQALLESTWNNCLVIIDYVVGVGIRLEWHSASWSTITNYFSVFVFHHLGCVFRCHFECALALTPVFA